MNIQSEKKVYIFDTNVLINDPYVLSKFGDNILVIPMVVLEELDNHKSRKSTGFVAREAMREILRVVNGAKPGTPIKTKMGGSMILDDERIDTNIRKKYKMLDLNKADNRILMVALKYKHDQRYSNRIIIVSIDGNVRAKAHMFSIASEEYKSDVFKDDLDEIYHSPRIIQLKNHQSNDFYQGGIDIKRGYVDGQAVYVQFGTAKKADLIPSLVSGGKVSVLDDNLVHKQFFLKPRNDEQSLAYRVSLDPRNKVLVLTGSAGTGKTLLSLAAGLYAQYNRKGIIRIVRLAMESADTMGYLPGDLDEKMSPYREAIENAYDVISATMTTGKKSSNLGLFDTMCHAGGKIRLKPINHDLGVTYRGFVILDEAQNMTITQMKLFLSRVGEKTRVIINGDINQISDSAFLTKRTSGLTHLLDKMRGQEFFSHVHLIKGERSEVATVASQLL